MSLILKLIIPVALICSNSIAADRFDAIKKKLADADCSSFKFVSILSSSVFDTKDSSRGTAQIAHDGRYRISLGADIYVCDGKSTYSYSPSTNQLVIQRLDSGSAVNKEISFLTRLDEYYTTQPVKPNQQYKLTRRAGLTAGNIPDSMLIVLDAGRQHIERIDYVDVNDEPVSIVLTDQKLNIKCDDRTFEPAFPDSAETVKL
ncbi:hypothetical protein C3F09_01465 [candidate division GN15 bacterium]|uniref:Outer membrane lipoprotein carrier protein LolA n=1 Tax=candidate division GN15 bacterium TaxID=2072418 RepID=A0A855XC77_9BACT|nr:MAG: hypothetical protein C3F09_01465 [candidate division GN15 bacterium]